MCNLSDGVEARRIRKGIETATVKSIESLMETLKLTAEQAMDALKVPKEEREKYIGMLSNQ